MIDDLIISLYDENEKLLFIHNSLIHIYFFHVIMLNFLLVAKKKQNKYDEKIDVTFK